MWKLKRLEDATEEEIQNVEKEVQEFKTKNYNIINGSSNNKSNLIDDYITSNNIKNSNNLSEKTTSNISSIFKNLGLGIAKTVRNIESAYIDLKKNNYIYNTQEPPAVKRLREERQKANSRKSSGGSGGRVRSNALELDSSKLNENLQLNYNKQQGQIRNNINDYNQKIQENVESTTNPVARKIAELAPAISNVGLTVAVSAINPVAGITVAGMNAKGEYKNEAINRGMTEQQAEDFSSIMAVVEGVTEFVGLEALGNAGKALRGITKGSKETAKQGIKTAFKQYGISVADNVIQESIIEPIQEVTALSVASKDYADFDNMAERMFNSGVNGGIVSAIVGGSTMGVNSAIVVSNKIQNNQKVTETEMKTALEDCQKAGIDIETEIKNNMKNSINKIVSENESNINNNQLNQENNNNNDTNQIIVQENQNNNINEEIKAEETEKKVSQKAENYKSRARTRFKNDMIKSFGVQTKGNQNALNSALDMIEENYKNKTLVPEKQKEIFNNLYNQLYIEDTSFIDENQHISKQINDTRINISDKVKNDIVDFNKFYNKNKSLINVDKKGVGIDVLYQELNNINPELFPENITHQSQQLEKIVEFQNQMKDTTKRLSDYNNSQYGLDALKWSEKDFDDNTAKFIKSLDTYTKFNENKIKQEKIKENNINEKINNNTVKEIYEYLPSYKKEYEKVLNKSLLTDKDKITLDRLINEEITVEEMPKDSNKEEIMKVYQAKKPYQELKNTLNERAKSIREARFNEAIDLIDEGINWKDKKHGISYRTLAPQRVAYEIMPKEQAQKINEKYIYSYNKNEAKSTKFINEYSNIVKNLNIDTTKKYTIDKVKYSESGLIQLYGERKITETQLEECGADVEKIKKCDETFRKIYNELHEKENEVNLSNGFEPVAKRDNYYPHFNDNFENKFVKFANKYLGMRIMEDSIPTEISGLTQDFTPGKRFVANFLERKSDTTTYDALEGFDRYIRVASDYIHHTDDIQNLRAYEKALRFSFSDENIKTQIKNINDNPNLSSIEKATMIDEIFENNQGINHMAKYVEYIHDRTNVLAGKKTIHDRGMEVNYNRSLYTAMTEIESRVAANIVGGNISVSLSNFAPLAQATGEVNPIYLAQGLYDTTKNIIKRDSSFVDNSDFLTNRRGSEKLNRSKVQKVTDTVVGSINVIDNFVSESIVRGKYYENLQNGMTEIEALENADRFAGSVMADRSKGMLPTIFDAKNPIAKINNLFQVELNNQLQYYFKDIPRNSKSYKDIITKMTMISISSFLLNEILKKARGNDDEVLPDPINFIKAIFEDVKNDKKSWEVIKESSGKLLNQIPFMTIPKAILGIEGESRGIPVQNALPSVGKIVSSALNSDMSKKKKAENIKKELAKPLYNLLPPVGGSQIKKTVEGIKAVNEGGSYTYDNEGNKTMQYEINKTAGNYIKAGLLGKNSLPQAKIWRDNNFKGLNAEETKIQQKGNISFEEIINYKNNTKNKTQDEKMKYIRDEKMNIDAQWDLYQLGIFSTAKREDGTTQKDDIGYMLKQGLTKKEILDSYNTAKKNNISFPNKEKFNELKEQEIKLNTYIEYKSQEKIESIKKNEALKNNDKIDILQEMNITKKEKSKLYENIINKNDDTYQTLKATNIDIDEYLKYKKQTFKSTQTSTKKQQVFDYINNMNINYNQRLLLIKLDNNYKVNNDDYKELLKVVDNLKITDEQKNKIYEKIK